MSHSCSVRPDEHTYESIPTAFAWAHFMENSRWWTLKLKNNLHKRGGGLVPRRGTSNGDGEDGGKRVGKNVGCGDKLAIFLI